MRGLWLSLTLSLSHTLTHSLTLSLFLSFSLALSLSLALSPALSLSLSTFAGTCVYMYNIVINAYLHTTRHNCISRKSQSFSGRVGRLDLMAVKQIDQTFT